MSGEAVGRSGVQQQLPLLLTPLPWQRSECSLPWRRFHGWSEQQGRVQAAACWEVVVWGDRRRRGVDDGAAALSAVSFSGRKAATNPSRTLHMLGWLGSHMAVTSAFSWMSAGLGRCESLLREGWVSE